MNKVVIETYNEFVEMLSDKGVACRTNFMDDFEIVVECGNDYPDELFDLIFIEAENVGIQENLCVCSEYSGGTQIASNIINGGPINYN